MGLNGQVTVNTVNTTSPNVCDGSACIDSNLIANIDPTTIVWAGAGNVVQQGSYCIFNLCAGTYTVTFDLNGQNTTTTFIINSGSGDPCNGFYALLNTQAATDAVACDATSSCTVTGGTAPYTFTWSNGATTSTASNLCADSYICCYVTDNNGCVYSACDSVFALTGNNNGGGDTLIINSGGGCNNSVGNFTLTIEDCTLDFNAIDTAFLSNAVIGGNPQDSTVLLWVVLDTNGVATTLTTFAPPFNANGCYDITLIIFCSGKSSSIGTIVVNSSYNYQSAGIELLQAPERKHVKTIDWMGREVQNAEVGGMLIHIYDDGSIEKVYRSEAH